MARKITDQVRDIAVVAKAVAKGDLSKKVTANAQGEVLELKNTMNRMVRIAIESLCVFMCALSGSRNLLNNNFLY